MEDIRKACRVVEPGVAGVNYSDVTCSNLSPVAVFEPGLIQILYEVKHNAFVYFEVARMRA